MQNKTLTEQFCQALANGDISLTDLGTVLEHVNGFVQDYYPVESNWILTDFEEVADEIYSAMRLTQGDEE